MKLKTLAGAAVGAAALMLGMGPQGQIGFPQAYAQETVRPEVGKHLKDAGALIKGGKYKEALGKVRDAEAVSGRTASEMSAPSLCMARWTGRGNGSSI